MNYFPEVGPAITLLPLKVELGVGLTCLLQMKSKLKRRKVPAHLLSVLMLVCYFQG
jgi:hypothetical protein